MLDRIKHTVTLNRVKTGLYIIAILMVAVAIQLVINRSFLDETKLVKAFENTKATPISGKLQVVGNFGDKFMTTEDKENLIDYVSSQLGITGVLKKQVQKGNTTISVTAEAKGDASETEIEAISITSKDAEKIEQTTQYLYVNIDIYDQMSSVLGYKDIIEDALKDVGLESVDSSILLTGVYEGKLSLLDKDKIANGILDQLQAKVIIENRSDGIYTIYGYTQNLDNSLNVEGERVNLNIGFSYDEKKEKTMLYLASPIINEDY